MDKSAVAGFFIGIATIIIGFVIAAIIVSLVNSVNFFEAFDLILGSQSPLAKAIVDPITSPEGEEAAALILGAL